jgi:hypothetical protein
MASIAHTRRKASIARSNNQVNPDKNLCILKVCQYLGVSDEVKYLHTGNDFLIASRKVWSVRSRRSQLGKTATVGGSRAKLSKLALEQGALSIVVLVKGHIIALNPKGETVCDTARRKRDARKIEGVYFIFPK